MERIVEGPTVVGRTVVVLIVEGQIAVVLIVVEVVEVVAEGDKTIYLFIYIKIINDEADNLIHLNNLYLIM